MKMNRVIILVADDTPYLKSLRKVHWTRCAFQQRRVSSLCSNIARKISFMRHVLRFSRLTLNIVSNIVRQVRFPCSRREREKKKKYPYLFLLFYVFRCKKISRRSRILHFNNLLTRSRKYFMKILKLEIVSYILKKRIKHWKHRVDGVY